MPTKPTTFHDGSSGARLSRSEFLSRLSAFRGDVVLFGENHSDPAGHEVELEVLRALHGGTATADRGLALSLEFFDREAQTVMDEYVGGHLSLEGFLRDSRPPGNVRAYLPLIDYCRESGLSVVAANCPRRYTRMVSWSFFFFVFCHIPVV